MKAFKSSPLVFVLCLNSSLEARQTDKIGVIVHIISDQQGNGGISLEQVQSSINLVNEIFSPPPINLEFIVVNTRFINSNRYANFGDGDLRDLLAEHNIQESKAINLYFSPSTAFNGIATLPGPQAFQVGEEFANQGIVVSNVSANTSTVSHEFGHFFGLFHTYESRMGHENPDGSNCSTAGDLFCDTPAERDPGFGTSFWNGCIWNGQTPYNPDPTNLMSRAPAECRTRFSPQQRQKIRSVATSEHISLLNVPWVKFTNLLNSANAGGTFKVGQDVFFSGEPYAFPSYPVSVETGQERFPPSYKHHDWNNNAAQFRLQLPNFQGSITTPPQVANFVGLNPATIFVSILDGGSGQIQFRDPWYLHSNNTQPDSFFTYTPGPNGFSPTGAYNQSTGGVFLNQNPLTTPTYYSVRVPLTINGIPYRVLSWQATNADLSTEPGESGYETKAVVFTDANASVTAKLKAYQASSYQDATGYLTV